MFSETLIGKTVRYKRRMLDLTQTQLANEIDVDITSVGSWERNKTFPKGEHLLKLMRRLNLGPDDFPVETRIQE